MPSPILHLTHAEMLARDPQVAAPLREAMAQEIRTARLGAIFPDLPFYTHIVPMTLGYWLEMRAESCPIALRMHSDHPDLFAWHFLCQTRDAGMLEDRERLALLGGFFSHIALDLELHPLVNWCARRDVIRYGGHESHHHRLAEKYHSLFFHIETEGRDCLGSSAFFNKKSRIFPDVSLFRLEELPVVHWTRDTLAFYASHAPTTQQVAHWMRTFRRFTFLVSLPFAKWNGERLGHAAHRARYFDNDDFRFADFWQRAYRRSVALLNHAFTVFCADDVAPLRGSFLQAAGISDLAYPPERNLPALPIVHEPSLQPALARAR